MNGRAYAVAGLVLGGAASISANLAHALYVQPHLSPVSVIGALFWPLATLIGFEVIVRPPWPTQGKGALPWWLCRLGVVGVAVVAVVTSYEHMSGLLGWAGDNPFAVRYGPAAIDGLMVTCAAALLVIERYAAAAPVEVADTDTTAAVSAPVEQTPAAAGVVHHPVRQLRQVVHAAAPPAPGEPTRDAVRALLAAEPDLSTRAAAKRLGVSPSTVARALRHPDLTPAPDGAPLNQEVPR